VSCQRLRWVEEVDDPSAGIPGRGLGTLGRYQLRKPLDPERQLRWVVIAEEGVAGRGIQLGVVTDAGRLERRNDAIEGFAHTGAPISAAVAGDDRAGLGSVAQLGGKSEIW